MVAVSQIIVLALGAIICLFSIWGIIAPDKIWKLIDGVMEKDWAIHFAVIVRLLLGAALLFAAPQSRFPVAIELLGWLAIVAAVTILAMGRDRLKRLIAWFHQLENMTSRVWLIFGFAFGAFLVFAVN